LDAGKYAIRIEIEGGYFGVSEVFRKNKKRGVLSLHDNIT
jgi:hypothetical protein